MRLSATLLFAASCSGGVGEGGADSARSVDTGDSAAGAQDLDGDGYREPADCDDRDAAVHPMALEACNDRDDDCDGLIDEEATDPSTWYVDADGDGYGVDAVTSLACEVPEGHSALAGDCDDENPGAHLGLSELCSTVWDDDCDSSVNDASAVDAGTWWPDVDDDGFGDANVEGADACLAPDGWVGDGGDCDDGDAAVRPSARDVCNDRLDQDCDGTARECPYAGALTVEAADATILGDGYFYPISTLQSADGDGDGVPDLLLAGYGDDLVAIFTGLRDAVGIVGLDQDTLLVSGTGVAGDAFGSGLGGGGDLDGDGVGDLLVGAENESTGAYSAGAVDVFLGPVAAGISHADAHATLIGEAYADRLTFTLLTPDIDGDGVADLVCGTPMQGDENGAVYVEWGPIPTGSLFAGQADIRLRGAAGSYFGRDSSAADLDGDGYVDLAVGALRDEALAGAVHLFSGASLRSASAEGHVADGLVVGEGGGFGGSVDARGDHDQSGAADLLVAALDYGAGFDTPGRTYIFSDIGLSSTTALDADVVLTGVGNEGYNGMAHWVGDINGDRYDDLVIGEGGIGDGGTAFLFYGPVSSDLAFHADADATIAGAPSDLLGGNVYGQPPDYRVGDPNADGFADFMLPAFGIGQNGGRVYLFRGAATP